MGPEYEIQMENIIHTQMVVECLTKEMYTEKVERAYMEWLLFKQKMCQTKLPGFPDLDWSQLGHPSFEGAKYAEQIQRTLCKGVPTTPETIPLLRICDRFMRCISGLIFIHYLENYGIPSMSADPYFVAYQLVSFTGKSLAELQTLARLNHLAPSDNKFEMARGIHLSRRWGFNTFAVKSQMNDDVLSKIKSFV